MKTWRERVAEARTRGAFVMDDLAKWTSPSTCPAGEMATKYGVDMYDGEQWRRWAGLWAIGERLRPCMSAGGFDLSVCNADEADRILDAIEDMALELKRAEGQ